MTTISNAAGQPSPSQALSSQPHSSEPRGARQQLERLYREIGISAVAAAVAQIRKPDVAPLPRRETPACLRDETSRAA